MLQQTLQAHVDAQLACEWQDRTAISHPSGTTGKPNGVSRDTAGPDRHLDKNISHGTNRWRNRRFAGWRQSCAYTAWQPLEQVERCPAERLLVTAPTGRVAP